MQTNSSGLFKRALLGGLALTLLIGSIGSVVGFLVVGAPGVYAALLGSLVALGFTTLTTLSVWLGGRLPLGGFFGLVLGGWLLKVLLFAIVLASLQDAQWFSGPVFFFALVAAVLGGLSLDSYLVLRSRIPIIEN